MPRRSYTEAEKAEALTIYQLEGPTAVERQLGIPKETVNSWARAAGLSTVRNERMGAAHDALAADRRVQREHLRQRLLEVASNLVERIDESEKTTGVRDLAVAAGILIDKFRLEVGEATTRTEETAGPTSLRDLFVGEVDDAEVVELGRALWDRVKPQNDQKSA